MVALIWRATCAAYPELARFDRDEDAKVAIRRAILLSTRSWRWQFMHGTLLLCWAGGVMLFIKYGDPLISWLPCVAYQALIMSSLGAMFLVEVAVTRNRFRQHLREILVQLGVPVCLDCGYDLTGLDSSRCPECGAQHEGTD
jgi:hypothetical protein